MGKCASVRIYVGVSSSIESELEDLFEKLPIDFFDDESREDFKYPETDKIKDKYGFYFEEVYCCEELVGVGYTVLYKDWDHDDIVDLQDVTNKANTAKQKIQDLFDNCGIVSELDVYVQTDYV